MKCYRLRLRAGVLFLLFLDWALRFRARLSAERNVFSRTSGKTACIWTPSRNRFLGLTSMALRKNVIMSGCTRDRSFRYPGGGQRNGHSGNSPENMRYKISPSEKTSDRSEGLPIACSGDMKPIVPEPEARTVFSATFAMPKSVNRIRLPVKIMKFSGLISQWMMRCRCA